MRRKRFSATLLVVAGVLACIAIPALAATPTVGKWKGSAVLESPGHTQKLDIKFSTVRPTGGGRRVKGFSLTGLYPGFKIPCTGGGGFATAGFVATVKPKVVDGRFKFTEKMGRKTLKATGRFTTKTRAKGTVTGTYSNPSVTCTTGKLNWTAKLR